MSAQTTVLADLLPQPPTFQDDLTANSGLRRWTAEEYHRMAYPVIFGPEERTDPNAASSSPTSAPNSSTGGSSST